jgi:hypothetical protein
VADYGHGISALLVAPLLRGEEPAQSRLHPEYGKIVPRDEFAPDAFRMVFFADTEWIRICHGQPGDKRQVVAMVPIIGIRTGHELAAGCEALEGL